MAHRLDKFTEELFGNRCIYFDRNTIYQHFYIRVIWANRANCTNGRKCRCGCSWRRVRAWENRKWEWNNIWQGLVNNFFLEKMFPVVIGVKWKLILFTPLPNGKTAGFLICKSDTLYSEWINYEIDEALRMKKPIIGIKPWGNQRIPEKIQQNATVLVGWNSSSLVSAVRNYAL